MRLRLALATAIVLHMSFSAIVAAQGKTIVMNLAARKFEKDTLPFGERFSIRGEISKDTKAVFLRLGRKAPNDDKIEGDSLCGRWLRPPQQKNARANPTEFVVDFPFERALRPDTWHIVNVILYEWPDSVAFNPGSQQCDIAPPPSGSPVVQTDQFSVRGRTTSDFKQRFNTDVGVIATHRLKYYGAATGIHFSVIPINENEDLANPGLSGGEQLKRRFSVFAGLAVKQFSSEAKVENSLPIGAAMAGVGFRGPLYWSWGGGRMKWLLQPMRVTTGFVWFDQKDANPLVDDKHAKRDLFAGLTLDIDYQAILGPFLNILGGK